MPKKLSRATWCYIAIVICCLLLYTTVRIGGLPRAQRTFFEHYGFHFIYCLGYTLYGRMLIPVQRRFHIITSLTVVLAIGSIATMMELLQCLSPTRVLDKYDLLLQVAGSIVALIIMLLLGPPQLDSYEDEEDYG